MTAAVIETGPGTIRRLDAGAPDGGVLGAETVAAALDALDEPVALVGDRPVSVDALWRTVLQTLAGGRRPVVVVHPSGWAAARVARVRAAARTLTDDVVTRTRASLLAEANAETSVVVEIGPRLVVVTADTVTAQPRTGDPARVAAATVRRVLALTPGGGDTVVLDAPSTVGGARELARLIAERLRAAARVADLVDDTRLARLARPPTVPAADAATRRRPVSRRRWLWAAALLPAGLLWLPGRPQLPGDRVVTPTTFLVEGRIAVQVPATWPAQRVTAGPGSARVMLTSPSDPQVALHITQSPVLDDTLADTAAVLQRALADQPPGVFVDFDPAAQRAGRPAVTYREVRAGHDIRWVIVLDDAVRISIGCQSPTGDEAAVASVCEQALRSARALHAPP